jgi:hypothetical protein
MHRPRIDLDGVALHDESNPHMPLASFRHRNTAGLLLLIPESGEVLVPWAEVVSAKLDLASGRLEIEVSAALALRERWLRGARRLIGEWMDRYTHRG